MRENWLCPLDKCQWYGDSSKYGRQCYYEPQCWRGFVDVAIVVIMLIFAKLKRSKNGLARK